LDRGLAGLERGSSRSRRASWTGVGQRSSRSAWSEDLAGLDGRRGWGLDKGLAGLERGSSRSRWASWTGVGQESSRSGVGI
jgi:hypothetical protein